MTKLVISIEGNIGTGKTSFLNSLKNKLSDVAEFIYEPVNEWLDIKDENGKNLLDIFYGDKKRWGYTFQNVAYITRMNNLVNMINSTQKNIIIIDRSLSADLNTFAKMLYNDGFISQLEWNAYNKWNDFFNHNYGKNIKQHTIYLRCDPQVSFERTKIRSRDEEKSIPLEYLKELHLYHDLWLLKDNKPADNTLLLDVNRDFVNDGERFEELFGVVKEYITKVN